MKKTKKVPNRVLLDVGKPSEQETQLTTRVEIRIVGQRAAKEMMGRAHACFLNPLRDKRRPIYVAALLGEEVAAELRTMFPEPPAIVVMSAAGTVAERAQRIGAVGYVAKPFDLDDLAAAVHRAIRSV